MLARRTAGWTRALQRTTRTRACARHAQSDARKGPRVVSQQSVFENPWLRLKTIRFLDLQGRERQWTGLERTTTYPVPPEKRALGDDSDACDAVVVFPFLTQPGAATQVILIRQFRPPVGQWVVELPAGLIDDNELPEHAARRELLEETGYSASRVLHIGPPMVNDQGLTNGKCRLVLMEVRRDADAGGAPVQRLEEDEMIQVLVAPLDGLVPWLLERQHSQGDAIDARLYSYALGLQALPHELLSA
ncbi:hypothetical protein ATCC90586_008945 [Pythium insidiosum]|nr:hypothetical protein ATCC90586_008945 [Pythium insidiosum]